MFSIRNRGESIAGFGAAAKGTILLNYCDIGPETIPFIFDDTPEKQGLYIPGVHIPIVPRAELDERRPDNLLVLPWNFLTEIVSRTATFGGSYIVVMPEMKVLKPERTAEIHISHDTVKVKRTLKNWLFSRTLNQNQKTHQILSVSFSFLTCFHQFSPTFQSFDRAYANHAPRILLIWKRLYVK